MLLKHGECGRGDGGYVETDVGHLEKLMRDTIESSCTGEPLPYFSKCVQSSFSFDQNDPLESSDVGCGKNSPSYSFAERTENISDCLEKHCSSVKLECTISNSDIESEEAITFGLRLESSGSESDSNERSCSSYRPQRQKKQHPAGLQFRCEECGKELSSKGNLSRHLRAHSGDRSYQCTDCKASFCQKGDLVKHKRIHTGEKPYQCSVCEASFRVSHSLVTHMRIHTGEKSYGCSDCQASFRHKCTLVFHKRIHTGEKPYKCSECGKDFTDKTSLIWHGRTHAKHKL